MTVAGTVRRCFTTPGRDLPASMGLALVLGLLPRLVGAVIGTAVGLVGQVGLAALYAGLRAAKDGPAPSEVADAFD